MNIILCTTEVIFYNICRTVYCTSWISVCPLSCIRILPPREQRQKLFSVRILSSLMVSLAEVSIQVFISGAQFFLVMLQMPNIGIFAPASLSFSVAINRLPALQNRWLVTVSRPVALPLSQFSIACSVIFAGIKILLLLCFLLWILQIDIMGYAIFSNELKLYSCCIQAV